ncbi:MAG TPA: hypothetical protein VER03_15000 [Bryobacteraceae bacterium]|nr:hypothetical protein [Bryobacteraceae bacterium]
MKLLLAALALFVASASAADVTGTWKGTAETENGTIERTFVFKQTGTTLTGESSSEMMGKSAIADGKVDGDNVSFTLTVKFQDNEMKLNYSGKVTGDTMKLQVEGAGFAISYNVKKTS